MERIIERANNGAIACNKTIIYTELDESEIGKKTRDSIFTNWEVIKPKYYVYKDDNCLIEIWYEEKGIVLDKGNSLLENGWIGNYWTTELRKEITYEEAMYILEQKQRLDKDLGYNNKDLMSRVITDGATEGLDAENLIKTMIEKSDANKCCEITASDKKQNNNGGASDFTPDYYGARCKCGEKIDAYAVCDKYQKPHKGSAWHHAVKKLIRAGDGHKHLSKDIDEVIDSLKRWKEQINSQDDKKK